MSKDPLQCELSLIYARTSPAWASPEKFDHCCAQLALALGSCRLFGVEPHPDIDGTLTAKMTIAAAIKWTQRVWRTIARANELSSLVASADDPIVAEDTIIGMLQTRTDAWAAYLAIDEGYEDALCKDERLAMSNIGPGVSCLIDAIITLDCAMRTKENLKILTAVTHLPLLSNWRENLAPIYKLAIPWWMA